MKGNVGKGTDFFKFMADFFKLIGDFYIIESNDDYWQGLMQASDKLLADYRNCDFYQFAKAMILAYNVYLSDVKYKQQKEGKWLITFKGD